MEQEVRPNLKISGVGSAGGGKFHDVSINGTGSINGDIECSLFDSNGASEIRGNIKAGSAKINGAAQLKGNIAAERMDVNGTVTIKGNIDIENIKVSGSISSGGNLKASNVDVRGAVNMDGDCEAETFRVTGGFKIGGLLNADSIYAGIYGNCMAKEIGGGKIEVKKPDNIVTQIQRFIKDIFNVRDCLVAEIIEGDDIYLETTMAKIVRGNNVTLGPGCDIGLVEYKEHIQVLEGARVKEQKMI